MKTMTTTVRNHFTGYSGAIQHGGNLPCAATLRRHLAASKAADCRSVTRVVREDGAVLEIESGSVRIRGMGSVTPTARREPVPAERQI